MNKRQFTKIKTQKMIKRRKKNERMR